MRLTLDRVRKRFGKHEVLRGVSLEASDGQFVALLGPSGCGKTTLLNAVAGLVDIEGGTIAADGEVWGAPGRTVPPEARRVGMVFQDFALWPHMTVADNVAFGPRLQRLPPPQVRRRVAEVLSLVQMEGYGRASPRELSGGQKQRVAIARALAHRPRLLLMDEPLSNLDARLREEMRWDLLRILRAAGTTTVYVTHDQVEALSMADHVVLLRDGAVEQEGRPTDLYAAPRTAFAATFLGASNVLQGTVVGRSGGLALVDWGGVRLRARAPQGPGEAVTLVVRPAHLRMAAEPGAEGLLPCCVRQRAFQGTLWQYRVCVEGRPDRALECWSDQPFSVDQRVWVDVPPDRCVPVVERAPQPA